MNASKKDIRAEAWLKKLQAGPFGELFAWMVRTGVPVAEMAKTLSTNKATIERARALLEATPREIQSGTPPKLKEMEETISELGDMLAGQQLNVSVQ